ncbi:MAG: hypothetical protein HYT39_00260, partial [Candidatus Sungbacteria bacterium]|nr:hypothetical protein [Candidatus Sungbacteria bacterium]
MESEHYQLVDIIKRTGRPKTTLLRWEREGKIPVGQRDVHGWRYYTRGEFEMIIQFAERMQKNIFTYIPRHTRMVAQDSAPKQKKIFNTVLARLGIRMFLTILIFVAIAAPLSLSATAGVPSVINYQGRLLNSSSSLLGGAGTNYCFKFSIYDNPTVDLGTKLWPSGSPATTTISVKEGVFNAAIGAGDDALTYDFKQNNTIYLNVEVGSQVSGSCASASFENLSPRQRIVSSGYAITAGSVFGTAQSAVGTTSLIASTSLTVEATSTSVIPLTLRGFANQLADLFRIVTAAGSQLLTFTSGGYLGIATSSPSEALSVAGNQYVTGTGLFGGALSAGTILLNGSSTFQNFTFINATGTAATTTSLTVTVTGYASTSALTVSNLNAASCDVKSSITGVLSCGT